jgi:hypothetical protein
MTTTTSIVSQSIGTSSNKGNGLFPQKITIQATTTAFVVAATLTNGAAGYDQGNRPSIWFATSPFSITAAAAIVQMRNTARYLELVPAPTAGTALSKDSGLQSVAGSYIYIWCDIPTVATAQTLDISVVELP